MMSVTKRPVGRPRKVSKDELADRLRRVFLKRGFSGTSLDDLVAGAEVERPSLYNAFGDKKSMYLAAYDKAIELISTALISALEKGDIRDALTAFYRAALTTYIPDAEMPVGCFAVGTTLAEAPSEPRFKAALLESILNGDRVLAARFERAVEEGQLSSEANPVVLGQIANSLLHGLAVRTRAGIESAELDEYIDNAVSILLDR